MTNKLVEVKIENLDGALYVSSRDVAEGLGKRHDNIMRDLDKIVESDSSNLSSEIIASTYTNSRGKEYREYLLTKDGFTLYMFNVQGYNEFKIAYINKFNEMEKALQEVKPELSEKDQLRLKLFSNDPVEVAAAHKTLVELETRPLIETIEEQKPLVDFASRVGDAGNAITIGAFAKALREEKGIKIGRNILFQRLREFKVLDKKNLPYQKFLDKGWFKVIEKTMKVDNDEDFRLYVQTLITGKGQVKVYDLLKIKGVI